MDRTVKITSREYGEWWSQYDESGLHPDERPPERLVALAESVGTVLSSTLPRAIETARHVTRGARDVPADPLFVEAPLPPPPVPFIKLRPGTWGVISRSYWFFGYAPNGIENHRQSWKRVARITARLGEEARRGGVLLCAHGYLNWMIGRRLRSEGWRLTEHDGGNRYWSWRIYEPVRDRRAAPSTRQAANDAI